MYIKNYIRQIYLLKFYTSKISVPVLWAILPIILSNYYYVLNCVQIQQDEMYNSKSSTLELNGLSKKNCLSVCTDSAPVMTGRLKEFVSILKNHFLSVGSAYYFTHPEFQLEKTIPTELTKYFGFNSQHGKFQTVKGSKDNTWLIYLAI